MVGLSLLAHLSLFVRALRITDRWDIPYPFIEVALYPYSYIEVAILKLTIFFLFVYLLCPERSKYPPV